MRGAGFLGSPTFFALFPREPFQAESLAQHPLTQAAGMLGARHDRARLQATGVASDGAIAAISRHDDAHITRFLRPMPAVSFLSTAFQHVE